jgi:hypothetical protein
MRRWFAGCAASSVLLGIGHADACPCQGSSGPGAALTSQSERVGASVTDTVRVVHGAWNPYGDYSALGDGRMQWLVDFAVALGYRPAEPLELGVQLAYGWQSVSAPGGFHSERTGFGDTAFNLRWEALDEPMPYRSVFPYPALAVIGGVRAPTGTVTRVSGQQRGPLQSGTTGAVGATASSQGLGAWEVSMALDAQKVLLARRLQLNLSGEMAFRMPDDTLGVERQLGPRALGQVNLRYMPSRLWGFGALTDLGWEGDITFDGERRRGTGQRLWSLGAFAYLVVRPTNLRSGILVRHAPPVDGISVNAVGATSIGVSLGYAL